MKKCINIVFIAIILVSCGGGGDEPVQPPNPINNAPTVPSLVYPTDDLLCTDNVLNFDWSSSTDPDGDILTYQIQVSKDNYFSSIEFTYTTSATEQSISLEKGVAYYWHVKAIDSKNLASSFSSVYSFYTEGEGEINHLPFSPDLITPELNSIQTEETTTLNWDASDVDNDPLLFDVFFDTMNPPNTKIESNLAVKSLNITIENSKNYYWYVVVKDGKGGETIGQIWNFKTD